MSIPCSEQPRVLPRLSLAEQLMSRADTFPDLLAFASLDQSKGISLTNADLCERAAAIAYRLAQRTSPGDRVLLAYDNPLEFIPAFFGCCFSGTIAVPVAPRTNGETVAAIVQDCGGTLALTAQGREGPPGIDWLQTDNNDRRSPFMRLAADNNPALLQYTSGSTRTPRGVAVTQASLRTTIEDLDRAALHDAQSVMVSWLPYFHDMGLVYGILTPLYCGFTAYLMPPESFIAQPLSWLRAMASVRGTHTAAPNFAYALCADRAADLAPGTDLSSMRFALNGAEPVRCDSVRRFVTAFAPFGMPASVVIPGYGLAEATLKVASGRCGEGTRSRCFEPAALAAGRVVPCHQGIELASCGTSSVGTSIVIVDPATLVPCKPDVVGEIWVAGQSVADGYWSRESETREIFQACLATGGGPWLRTGDLGFLQQDELFVVGRLKDLIIVGGRNIYCHDLEDSVSECHPDIRKGRVFAVAIEGEDGEAVLIGAEVRSSCKEGDTRDILSRIRTELKVRHDIGALRIVLLRRGSILRTSSGKTRRAATRDALFRGELQVVADSHRQSVEADDDILLEIARFVPGAVGERTSRLIDAGLDSLSAARLAAAIYSRYGVRLKFETLYTASADSLCRDIANAQSAAVAEPLASHAIDCAQPFELSEMQQAYWIGQQSGVPLGSVQPHIRVDFEVDHSQVSSLSLRLAALVTAHPALRMSVQEDGCAVIDPRGYAPVIAHRDLRGLGQQAISAGLSAAREELAQDNRHPLSVCFTRLTDAKTVLHLRLGLLAGDLRSLLLLVRELVDGPSLVSGFRRVGTATSCVPFECREAWLKKVESIAPAPDLPQAMAATDIDAPRFVMCRQELSEELTTALALNAQALGVTLSSICMAAFVDVLRLWSASPALTINVTCSTRSGQAEQAIGDFTSSTLLSLREPHDSFADFAQAIQQQIWRDLDEPWSTGVSMLRELSRRNGAPVLMPIVVTSLLSGDQADDLSVLDSIGPMVDVSNPTPQVSLHNILARRDGRLLMMWEYVEQLFPAGLIETMFASFVEVLTTIATRPSAVEYPVLAKIPVSQQARHLKANSTSCDRSPRRLATPFITHATESPDAIAVVFGDLLTTYGDLRQDAEDIAARLQRKGVRRGDVIAAIVEPGPRAVAALIGIGIAGAVYLPIEPSWPLTRIEELLYESKAGYAVLTHSMNLSIPTLQLDQQPGRLRPEPVDGDSSDVAYVIFTSGSTGRPKGVVITHEAAANTIDDINERFSVGPRDRALCVSSLAFDLSVYDIFGLLAVGGAVVFPERSRDPDAIAQALTTAGVTIWNSVPAVLELLLDVAAPHSSSLRLVLLSGDWIAPALTARIRQVFTGAQPISLGGATEVSIWSVIHPIVPSDAVLLSIPYGTPLSNQQCFVRAPDGRERPDGVAGELLLGGRGLALAYCGNDAETNRRFFTDKDGNRLYRTGDLARWMSTGELELLGRMDKQVKVQGYRIELGEIEAVAMKAGGISRAVASVVRRSGATVIQLHVLASQEVPGEVVTSVRAALALHLPTYMQPHHVGVLDVLPLTANGKVDRSRLPAPPEPKPVRPVRGDVLLETMMMQAYVEVVGIGIDPQQRFFDAGATSLHIVRLRALLESRGIAVPSLADFFSLATIRSVATSSLATSTGANSNQNDIAYIRAYKQRVRARRGEL
ncbi:amino acid adenylation domain-containing protein [Pseudomonas chlororaphis]|uniref:non-ribosomal peptide synthetase n=1 Tax=Pseudomonas chlororaphis TaxID=587753 RepID=UPI0023677051|nr:non-ribosomal peptide synthetase [Pseudomonas chlororaphis]WDG77650.1 amino acid adenylation domain-containing protein [Pseudomonas chlororaphis]WDG83113.1 amino acid adenylation domain-containing protein [Pseudomonas chlororaphis]